LNELFLPNTCLQHYEQYLLFGIDIKGMKEIKRSTL